MKKSMIVFGAMGLSGVLGVSAAWAAVEERTIVIKGHRFEPAEMTVPAGVKIKLTIDNQDPTPEEFESYELNREKVVPGRSKSPVFVGPLAPGRYPFFGEFNKATAQGALVVASDKGGR